jgi:hypothetical protein
MFWVSNSAHKSPIVNKVKNNSSSIKKIELVVWETLNRARYANEKLAWGDLMMEILKMNFSTHL